MLPFFVAPLWRPRLPGRAEQYICENHFQRISNRSLFTGLKAVNHFGRPDIAALLQHVQDQHSCVSI